ncbi:MAG: HepT-like ribonuclease domain-containing protein [Devosia sp.]
MIDERLAVYLDVMKQASVAALAFTTGLSKADFLRDQKTQYAVVMALIRIGESVVKIERRSPEFIANHPDWPWNEVRAIRNRGAHDYQRLNFDIIWETARDSLPHLVILIDALGPLDPREQTPHSAS